MKKYTYLLVFFLVTIISPSHCQQLELVQRVGGSGNGMTYSSEYIDFGEVTNFFVATDSESSYGLINRFLQKKFRLNQNR